MNKKMKYRRKIAAALALVIMSVIIFTCMPTIALAAEGNPAGFTVKAHIPSNQIDKTQSYFDLLMKPEQKQTISVTVYNSSENETMTIDLSAVSASTNRNGVIDYCTPKVRDETLEIPFSEISEVKTPVIELKPKQSSTATIEIAMPKNKYDGTVLGGLTFHKRHKGKKASDKGMNIQNVYSYVIGVKLTEKKAEVSPDFEMIKAKPEQMNHYAEITHYIRNFKAAIAKNITLTNRVFWHEKEEYIVDTKTENIDMAPNSVLPFGLSWPGGEAIPGKYTSYVRLEMNEKVWEFQKDFEVSCDEANDINRNAIIKKEPVPPWNIFMIGMGILIIALLVIIIFLLKKRKRENKD